MRTAFATVIYQQAKPFLDDFLRSIDNQTDNDFELILINDNYSNPEIEDIVNRLKGLTINYQIVDFKERKLSIAGTRIEMLKYIKKMGYDLLVLGDADDTFSPNRVEQCKYAYNNNKQAAFFYNKLITDKGYDIFDNIPLITKDIDNISQQNYLGLSTSAIRMSLIKDDFLDSLYEGESPVFDWYLFSRIIMDVGEGILVRYASTIYRIYDNNMVGTSRDITREYDVKMIHYTNLAKRYDYFKYLLEELKKLDIKRIKQNENHQGYWWSDIKMEVSYEI